MLEREGVSITTVEDRLVYVLHSAHPVDFVLDGSPGGTPECPARRAYAENPEIAFTEACDSGILVWPSNGS